MERINFAPFGRPPAREQMIMTEVTVHDVDRETSKRLDVSRDGQRRRLHRQLEADLSEQLERLQPRHGELFCIGRALRSTATETS